MASADEIRIRAAAADRQLRTMQTKMQAHLTGLVRHFFGWIDGREVSARRARKLRKAGRDVRFSGFTPNGKTRYLWRHKDWGRPI